MGLADRGGFATAGERRRAAATGRLRALPLAAVHISAFEVLVNQLAGLAFYVPVRPNAVPGCKSLTV